MGASLAEVARACEVNPKRSAPLAAGTSGLWNEGAASWATASAGRGGKPGLRTGTEGKVGRRWRSIFCVAACRMSRSSGSCRHWIPAARLPIPRKRDESGDAHSAGTAGCRLGLVSRAGFYRWKDTPTTTDADLDLRDEIQRIALEFPYYGWPRITRSELEKRGCPANHKRVYRIMREDNLLCLRRRKFVVVTTNSNHTRPIYPNLARGMALTGINQLWVADITYIRLELEFVYLAVILGMSFSRRVIGWALDRTLEDRLTIASVADGIRQSLTGAVRLVHHSDRRRPVRFQRLHRSAERPADYDQHEPEGKPLRQRILRIIHEDAQIRRSPPPGVPRSGRSAGFHRTLPGTGVQLGAASLGAQLRRPGGLRKRCSGGQQDRAHENELAFYQAWRNLSLRCVITACRPGPKSRVPDGSGPSQKDAPEVSTPYSSSRRVPAGYSSTGCSPAVPVSASPARPS